MGRGSSGLTREKGGSVNPADILGTTDMISARANYEEGADITNKGYRNTRKSQRLAKRR